MKLEIGIGVMHNNLGLCKVIEHTNRDDILYFKLQTISQPCSTLYIPAMNENDTCRDVMNKQEVDE